MTKALQLIALYLAIGAPFYLPHIYREWKRQQASRAKWDEVSRQRLRDIEKSKRQKQQLEKRRRAAAAVQLPRPKAERRHYTIKPPPPPAVPMHLLFKLDGLTSSREISDRLIDGLSDKHPGKPRRWLVEKAIADLERDRRV